MVRIPTIQCYTSSYSGFISFCNVPREWQVKNMVWCESCSPSVVPWSHVYSAEGAQFSAQCTLCVHGMYEYCASRVRRVRDVIE